MYLNDAWDEAFAIFFLLLAWAAETGLGGLGGLGGLALFSPLPLAV